jgi:hypothetical protein
MRPFESIHTHLMTTRLGFCVLALALSVALPSVGQADPTSMTVERENKFDQHVREREARERQEAYERQKQARAAEQERFAEEHEQRRRNGGKTDDEIELESFHARTLGGACMYGPEGEVLYRPSGARCKGDPAPRSNRAERAERAEAVERPRPAAPAAAAPVSPPQSRSTMLDKIQRNGPRKERCLWVDGRIAFKPEGVDCYAR